MKYFILLLAIFGATRADVIRSNFIVPVLSQFHSQDSLGQYSYGYSDGRTTKQELKTFDGITRGSYSYVDAEGKLQSVDYTADALNGFKVSATNLPKALPAAPLEGPKPVQDTLEVMRAKEAHMMALDQAKMKSNLPVDSKLEIKNLPVAPAETPEVMKAKEAHMAAHKEAEIRNSLVRSNLEAISAFPLSRTIPLPAGVPLGLPLIRTANGFAYSVQGSPIIYNSRFLSAAPLIV